MTDKGSLSVLTRDDILALNVVLDRLETPYGVLFIKGLSGEDRDSLEASIVEVGPQGQVKNVRLNNLRATIAQLCLCDEQGNRLFSKKDIPALAKRPAAFLELVANRAQELSAISEKDIQTLVSDLKKDRAEDSPSD